MKTQINTLHRGHGSVIGSKYEERKRISDLVHAENPEILNVKVGGTELALRCNHSKTGKTFWYASGHPPVEIVAHFFPNTFDVVLGERIGVSRKPDPQIVYDILSLLHPVSSSILKEELEEVLYIGDSLVDAETAKAAKLPFVACTWGFCTREQLQTAQPDYTISHPLELLNISNIL